MYPLNPYNINKVGLPPIWAEKGYWDQWLLHLPPVSKGRDLRLTGPGTSGAEIGGNALWRELVLMSS